jgi:NTE family protein
MRERESDDDVGPQSTRSVGAVGAPQCRIGLAFGGGLPFGLVALGVRQAFDEAKLPVARLAGTSMGSIFAATWALGIPVEDSVREFKQAFNKRHMLAFLLRDLSFSRSGIFRGAEVQRMLETFIGKDRTFEDATIPLRIPACDLTDGTEVVFESGPMIPAIRASVSLPGILTPFRHENRVFVDGALIRPIPIHLLREDEVDLKIPIRAVRKRPSDQLTRDVATVRRKHRLSSLLHGKGESFFQVLWRSLSLIMQDEFAEMIFDDYDVYIKPRLNLELSRDPSRVDDIIQAGYVETVRVFPLIREAMKKSVAGIRRVRAAGGERDPLGLELTDEVHD